MRIACGLAVAFAIGGCANIEYNTFRLPDVGEKLRLPAMSAPVVVEQRKPLTAEDMVDAEGRCTSTPMASVTPGPEAAGNDPVTVPTSPALAAGGIGLGMSECDVVKRAGPPEKITIGTNERAERSVVLTYTRSVRPGIFSFVAGRLVTIERVDEPPPQPKPARPAKPAKPKPRPSAT